ncbi:MAG: cytochrome P450 [Monoraphidium minutum]|nr:MAG: cytochrome P450 [Monoraphidium minutum]
MSDFVWMGNTNVDVSLPLAHYSIVCFLDSADGAIRGRVLRWPRGAPISDLIAAVGALHDLDTPRLFLEATREELLPGADASAALEAASAGAAQLLLLIATPGGPLSEAAAMLPRLAPPPRGPRPLPLVGNALCMTGPYESPFYNAWHHLFRPEAAAAWGDTVLLRLPVNASSLGDTEGAGGWDDRAALCGSIMTCDPDVAAEMLGRQDDFPKARGAGPTGHMFNRPIQRQLQEFSSNGLFTSDTSDPDWASAHGLLPRFFNTLRVKGFYATILDKTRAFVQEWDKRVAGAGPQGALVPEINDWLACMTADAVVKCAVGLDMHNVERKGARQPLHPFMRIFRAGLSAGLGKGDIKGELGWSYYCPFVSKKAALYRILRRARKEAEDLVSDMVEKTRRGEIGDSSSVIAGMLNDKAPNTGEYVRLQAMYGHIINLMVAGHETTAATLGWTLYHLSKSPECEAKALAEIQEVLGDAAEPTADHIPKLAYLEACFREALRLHPPVVQLGRDAAADTLIKNKWLVRRGQRVIINLVALHRREDIWGGPFGDPNAFNPERFMPGACEKLGLPPRHPQAFLPWGFGVRSCIGQFFALWEAKAFLAVILPRFKLRAPVGYVAKPSNKEGGAAPTACGLAFHIHARPNAPPTAPPAAAAPAAPQAAAAPAAAPAAGATAAASHGTPLAVLYGSNSGMCEDFAQQLAAKARAAGFSVTMESLDLGISGGALPAGGAVAVVTSTYNGMPPDNAAAFAKWLTAAGEGAAAGARFAVFGVGNSQWAATFQAFPKRVDAGLARAGGSPLLPLASVDVDQAGVTDAFEDWSDALVGAALSALGVAGPAPGAGAAAAAAAAAADKARVEIEGPVAAGGAGAGLVLAEAQITASDVAAVRELVKWTGEKDLSAGYGALEVLESRELLPPSGGRHTRHVELGLPEGMTYTAGDHLEVIPTNCPALVDAALAVLGLTGDERFLWTAGSKEGAARGLSASLKPPARLGARLPGVKADACARLLLSYLCDLSSLPSRKLVAALAEACPCPPEAGALRQLAGEEGYAAGVAGPKLTLVELLARFRSVPMSLGGLINALPRLAPRYYSISSSPLADPRRCSITVGLVGFTSATGRVHTGAASGLIHTQPVGKHLIGMVRCLQSTFKLPKDPSTPIIMVGPGTGLAPMRGFLQEREALLKAGTPLGPALLFFGCRSASEDFIYRDTLEGWADSGVLSGLHVAFSRDGPSKVYVQDLIAAQAAAAWALLEAGAYVYVCGDARRMAPDVRRAFMAVAREAGGRSEASAQNWMGALLEAGRYLEDVWAG